LFEYILFGGSYAFASAIQPGPLQAFLLARVAQNGWKRTLPAALSPLLSDGPIALVVLLVLKRVPDRLSWVLQIAGGLFLLYIAVATYRQWKGSSEPAGESSAPRTVFQAAVVNILNPNPYLGWSLVLGPQVLRAWSYGPTHAVALVSAFYVTMVTSLGLTIMLFGASRYLGGRGRRVLVFVSALALAALGFYLLLAGFSRMALF
jgi:threonine/homoserine/homoserine lactone efflux protein